MSRSAKERVRRGSSTHLAAHAGTYADTRHVQTADDAADVAEKVLSKRKHEFWKKDVGRIGNFLNSPTFESALACIISLNLILIIVETDQTAEGQVPPAWITQSNVVFLAVYAAECVTKIVVFRFAFFQETWNWLDLLVVFTDTCFAILNIFFTSVEHVSMIRIFRLVKLLRMIRVLRQVWELKILLLGFQAAAKSIFFGMGMVVVGTLVWAILGVQLIHPVNSQIWADSDCERCQRAYSSVWDAFITIFETVIVADAWGDLAIPLIETAWWTFLWFFGVLVTLQLGLLNLILAVIVERAADARDKEERRQVLHQEEKMRESKLELIRLCKELDKDGDGRLSEDEFLQGFETNPVFAEAMVGMGVYPEDVGLLFDVMDVEGEGEVSYISFVNTLSRVRTQMSQVILFSISELRKSVARVEKQFASTPGSVRLQKDLLPSPNDARQRAPSPGEGLRGQLEEMTRQMQCQLQQIQSEMSNSFQEAVQVMLETTETFETLVKVQSGSQGEECEMPKAPHPKDVPEDFPEVQDEPQANRIPPDRMKPEKDKDQANHPGLNRFQTPREAL